MSNEFILSNEISPLKLYYYKRKVTNDKEFCPVVMVHHQYLGPHDMKPNVIKYNPNITNCTDKYVEEHSTINSKQCRKKLKPYVVSHFYQAATYYRLNNLRVHFMYDLETLSTLSALTAGNTLVAKCILTWKISQWIDDNLQVTFCKCIFIKQNVRIFI